MSYPQFRNKHVEEALFDPGDYITYKSVIGKIPKKIILVYSDRLFKYLEKNYKLKKIKIYSLLTVYSCGKIGFVKFSGIGSSYVSALLEELIFLGGKEFLNIGIAGGLFKEGIFLCNKAIRDEGTSYHYLPHGQFVLPNKQLTKRFGNSIKKLNLEYEEGITWTIDAPYRETKAEIKHFKKMGVKTVEMEASALFAVAKFRKVKISSPKSAAQSVI